MVMAMEGGSGDVNSGQPVRVAELRLARRLEGGGGGGGGGRELVMVAERKHSKGGTPKPITLAAAKK